MNYADSYLSDLAIAYPMATEVFRKNRLDFCCGGRQTLKEACAKKEINLDEITNQIKELESKTNGPSPDKPLPEMTKYIVNRYHLDLRKRLPELFSLAEKVERVHSDHPFCPKGLTSLLSKIQEELFVHMLKEENILFPLIEAGRGNKALMPIKVMMSEHDSHGRQLDELHLLTSDFVPPEGACTTWRALYKGLEKLEEELMEHIHLENNILFPGALKQSGL